VLFPGKYEELPLMEDVVASIKQISFKKKVEAGPRVGRQETLIK
jgi:hypothetical protein